MCKECVEMGLMTEADLAENRLDTKPIGELSEAEFDEVNRRLYNQAVAEGDPYARATWAMAKLVYLWSRG